MSPPLARLAAALLTAMLALVPRATAPLAAVASAPASPARRLSPSLGGAAPVVKASSTGPRDALVAADGVLAERVARDGWAEGLSASLAEDAVYLHPGEPPARGKTAIAALLARAPGSAARATLRRVVAGVSADGTLGYAWGVLEEGTGADARAGRWLAAWRRTEAGWRVAALVRANAKAGASAELPAGSPLALGYAGVPRPGAPASLVRGALDADRAFSALAARYAKAQGYGPAFADTADAAAMLPGAGGLLWGAEAIRAGFRTEPGEELSWAPDHGEAAASGDLAWTTGRAVWRGGGEQAFTKYLSIWARQADGSWRWLLDLGNRSPAPPP